MKKHFANVITYSRILFSVAMLFVQVFTCQFYVLYLFCGISDMVDGIIARKTNSSSKFGERLDSFADFIFLVVSLVKVLPIIHFSTWLLIWIVTIATIKLSNILLWFIYEKKLLPMHTIMNKTAGFMLFLLPLTMGFIEFKYSSAVVCFVVILTAVAESYVVIKKPQTLIIERR